MGVPRNPWNHSWLRTGSQIRDSNLTRFQRWLHDKRGLDLNDHRSLYDWSVRDLDGFWRAIAEFFDVRFHTATELEVLHHDADPLRTRWFPGGTVNYAEHMLRFGLSEVPVSDDRLAVLFCAEPGEPDNRQTLTRKELIEQVAQLASALSHLGVRCGDRVAGYLPNRIETLVAFLATASLGAIWSNCPPELSSKGVLERLTQIEPKVLFALAGYRYGGKQYDRRMALAEIAAGLPTLRQVIMIATVGPLHLNFRRRNFSVALVGSYWSRTVRRNTLFPRCAFRSSAMDLVLFGNDGCAAKPIAHGHGGILLEHLKALSTAPGSQTRRQILLVHNGWLDDVELSGVRPRARSQCGPL